MVKRNQNIAKLPAGYLFPEINKRKQRYISEHPDAKLISLGIGDTTLPLPHSITEAMKEAALSLGTETGYRGYGPEQGEGALRTLISEKIYGREIDPDEIFISDGCKCDLGRLQIMFGADVTIAVQDPTYPVYVDTSIIVGQTNHAKIIFMPCTPGNHFCPDLEDLPHCDLLYITSPNNPTGTALTHSQLQQLVTHAKKNRSIIVYDAAYSLFIRSSSYPKSIFEIPGAQEVAIELNSFSKIIGFTGVRLGWSVVPKKLMFDDHSSVHQDWSRMTSTFFNGASNIAQAGGIAVLQEEGLKEVARMTSIYLENATIIKRALEKSDIQCYGGEHAPYIWAHFPQKKSWDIFEYFLKELQLVTTPGSGFGPSGEGYLRFSAFGKRADVEAAMLRI